MKEIRDMIRTTGKFHDKIQAFCAPLIKAFGISQFYHARISNSGQFIGVNLNSAWEEFFLSNTSHLLLWPDKCQPCNTKNGIRLLQETTNEDLNILLRVAREKYLVNFSLQFVEKSNYETNMYGFALNSSDPLQHMTLLKELPLLRLFLNRFQERFKKLYDLLEDNKVDLPALLGPSFYKVKQPAMSKLSMRDQFLKQLGINLPAKLTDREIDVIKLLMEGYSAPRIALELFISKRTIEHHIERIKDKFTSSSKQELIHKIRELESIGYFSC